MLKRAVPPPPTTTTRNRLNKLPYTPFRESGVTEINDGRVFESREWYLAFDSSLFHVYVIVRLYDDALLRIDWNRNSTLTFEYMTPDEERRESRVFVGHRPFSKLAVERAIAGDMQHYQLFRFNCRTVSFLVLNSVAFDPELVFALYEKQGVMCGLEDSECVKLGELRHYLEWSAQKDIETMQKELAQSPECIIF